jgi:Transposase
MASMGAGREAGPPSLLSPVSLASGSATWLVELLEDYGFAPHLVHSLRCKAIASARLKNDKVDAAILAQLLRADLLPEAWIAPPAVRQLRALLRHRVHLVRLRTLLRNRIHAIVAEHGHDRPAGGYWSGPGRAGLAALELPAVSRELVEDDLGLIDALQERVDRLDWEIRQVARSDQRRPPWAGSAWREPSCPTLAHADDSALSDRMLMPGCACPCTFIVINGAWFLSRIPSRLSRLAGMSG